MGTVTSHTLPGRKPRLRVLVTYWGSHSQRWSQARSRLLNPEAPWDVLSSISSSGILGLCVCVCVCVWCVCLGPYLQQMASAPKRGVTSEPQLLAYTTATAMPDPGCICDQFMAALDPHPPSEARDQTHLLMDTSWAHYGWATTETPRSWLFNLTSQVKSALGWKPFSTPFGGGLNCCRIFREDDSKWGQREGNVECLREACLTTYLWFGLMIAWKISY